MTICSIARYSPVSLISHAATPRNLADIKTARFFNCAVFIAPLLLLLSRLWPGCTAWTSERFSCWSDLVVDGSKWEKRPKCGQLLRHHSRSRVVRERESFAREIHDLSWRCTIFCTHLFPPSRFFFRFFFLLLIPLTLPVVSAHHIGRVPLSRIVRQTSESHGRERERERVRAHRGPYRSHLRRIGRFHRTPGSSLVFIDWSSSWSRYWPGDRGWNLHTKVDGTCHNRQGTRRGRVEKKKTTGFLHANRDAPARVQSDTFYLPLHYLLRRTKSEFHMGE